MNDPVDGVPQQDFANPEGDSIVVGRVIQTSTSPELPVQWRDRIENSALATSLVTFLALIVAASLFLVVSLISAVIAVLLVAENPSESLNNLDQEALATVFQSRLGLAIAIVPPQIALLVSPFIAGFLFPKGIRQTLLIRRGRWPYWAWIAAACVAPLIGVVSSTILGSFQEESDHLRQLADAFRYHSENGFLIPLALLIGVTPAICEEVLFRGLLQPRLIRLTNPGIGILGASLAFAIFHLDPVHSIAVFPLGLWLGYISYRSQSLYPAMFAHLVNNVLSVVLVGTAAEDTLAAPDGIATTLVLFFGLSGGISLLVGSFLNGKRTQAAASGE